MAQNLFIFVDALPYHQLPNCPSLNSFPVKRFTRPSLGYSINLHIELFAGMTPDQVGFFNVWGLAPEKSPAKGLRWMQPLLKAASASEYWDELIRSWIKRRNGKVAKIPLHLLPWFAKLGKACFSEKFSHPTLMSRLPDVAVAKPELFKGADRDPAVFYQAREDIDKHQNVFAVFMSLDKIGHDYGVGSPQYVERLLQIDRWIADLTERFTMKHSDGNVFVMSDHGMANTQQPVNVDFERIIRRAGSRKFAYFVDSVMARVWLFDRPDLTPLVTEKLHELGYGSVLSAAERAEFGLTSPRFGDLIYVLDEGAIFSPDFFVGVYRSGEEVAKAMHGYHPRHTAQHGIYLYRGPLLDKADLPDGSRLLDVYRTMVTVSEPPGV